FGSGITTWACLISVVLFAMMVGYTVGGIIADRSREIWIVSSVLSVVGVYLILVAFLANRVMEVIMLSVGYDFWGIMLASVVLTFLPVAFLAALSPFFVRLLLKELEYGGRITGAVYGVSTMGNVLGTLVTVFVFIPNVGTSKITVVFGGVLIACGVASLVLSASGAVREV
ncbi:MAG: fused MFS/spermidine synthase, partial [Deltaproteobacteria bacterium]|nr:fused MFS/spermidine synthase [Deltaproteobacteria bacterium]